MRWAEPTTLTVAADAVGAAYTVLGGLLAFAPRTGGRWLGLAHTDQRRKRALGSGMPLPSTAAWTLLPSPPRDLPTAWPSSSSAARFSWFAPAPCGLVGNMGRFVPDDAADERIGHGAAAQSPVPQSHTCCAGGDHRPDAGQVGGVRALADRAAVVNPPRPRLLRRMAISCGSGHRSRSHEGRRCGRTPRSVRSRLPSAAAAAPMRKSSVRGMSIMRGVLTERSEGLCEAGACAA